MLKRGFVKHLFEPSCDFVMSCLALGLFAALTFAVSGCSSSATTLDAAMGDAFDASVGDAFDASVGDAFDAAMGDAFDAAMGDALIDTTLPREATPGDAADPNSYFISPTLATDNARREFASVADFLAQGPSCLSGGEKIWLKSGERFVGPLVLKPCSGARGAISVSTYGGKNRAMLTGARSITALGLSWTMVTDPIFNGQRITHLVGKPLYRAGPITKEVQQLYYKGTRMSLARHPNEVSIGSADTQYFSADAFWEYSPTGCQAPTCVTGKPSEDGVWPLRTYGRGPDTFAVIRTSNWTLQRSDVTWVTSDPDKSSFAIADSLRIEANGNSLPTAGYGFVLLNALPLLDHKGEWVWHRGDQYLYFWAPDDLKPQEADSLVSFIDAGSLIRADFAGGDLDLVVTDLILEHAAHTGVQLNNGRHLTVERVEIVEPATHGVYASLRGTARVADCEIHRPGNNGIVVYNMEAMEVVDNLVTEPGRIHNQPSLIMNFNGIRGGTGANTIVVQRNRVRNAGYAGIMLGPAVTSMTVAANAIDGYCELLNDCGGVYYNGKSAPTAPNHVVSGNTFSGSKGNTSGVPSDKAPIAAGVYLDHGASGFVISQNTVTNSNSINGGIFLHGGNNNQVEGNIVTATYGPAFAMRKIEPSFPSMSGNSLTNNSLTTSSAPFAVVRFVDPSRNNCAGMSTVIKPSNTLTHTVTPTFLEMCHQP